MFIELLTVIEISMEEGFDAAEARGFDGDPRQGPRPFQEFLHDLGALGVVEDIFEGTGEEYYFIYVFRRTAGFPALGVYHAAVVALGVEVLPPGGSGPSRR
jgi:hypothetical protein